MPFYRGLLRPAEWHYAATSILARAARWSRGRGVPTDAASFPLGGFNPLQSQTLTGVAARPGASRQQVVLAWLLQRWQSMVLIPGTSSVDHLRENIAAAELVLPADAIAVLDAMGQ
ncbi:aldo/keto reductase [Streptomyces sp. NBC_00056]|uniref:aldo/keto reductase n=1 Tax=unclassified Streptomyces TaxID=2593676 RepID=UPI003D806FEC